MGGIKRFNSLEYMDKSLLITLLGPTASGKTRLAAHLAAALDGEILSADSRQVYKGMDIGTGKDLGDYLVGNYQAPYHLIDRLDAGCKYNVFEFQHDFLQAWSGVKERGRQAILCGGTGLYLEAVLRGYRLVPVPPNPSLRAELEQLDLDTLTRRLATFKTLHNTTDVDTVKRAVRAIEIETYYAEHPELTAGFPTIPSVVFGMSLDREERRRRISQRLHDRLQEGLVEEVAGLLTKVPAEDLLYYGLEYKYVGEYVLGSRSHESMVHDLEIAIHQFAKRQMTWFRGMERRGITIHWLNALEPVPVLVEQIKSSLA